jgi:hypothetical protein
LKGEKHFPDTNFYPPWRDRMSPTTKVFLREELYERVWTTPMHRLAKEFGYSDVGLAKV